MRRVSVRVFVLVTVAHHALSAEPRGCVRTTKNLARHAISGPGFAGLMAFF